MRDSRQLAEVSIDTFSINSLGSRLIYTMEPENVKTIFATNFKDFGIPQTRKDALAIFGPGIFSSDGHFWEASRALLRPILSEIKWVTWRASRNMFLASLKRSHGMER
jgi:hypothetical protein